jgi:peptide/nickel transport system permease protein
MTSQIVKGAVAMQGTRLATSTGSFLATCLRHRSGVIGVTLFIAVAMLAVLGPWLAPHNPIRTNIASKLLPPFWMDGADPRYLLGTDNLGRDILSRLLVGARVSLIVGIGATLVAGLIGGLLGLVGGFFGGPFDRIMSRVVDAVLAIPTILFILVIISVVGAGLTTLILVIGCTSWVNFTRIVRGDVIALRNRDFVRAARALGASQARILFHHILPNALSSFVVIATISVARVIILEASLSFLGLGIQSPDISWGGMLSDGRQYIATHWWVTTLPGLAITVTVLSVIFIGDWLRDTLDPRLNQTG